jgi:hypothetical protein
VRLFAILRERSGGAREAIDRIKAEASILKGENRNGRPWPTK